MRTAALALVLITARVFGLAGQSFALSAWLVPALLWHDLLVVAAFALLEGLTRRWSGLWGLYGLLVCWVAINIPVVRALSSPLTITMVRAAGGALRDSIAYYITPFNVLAVAAVLAVGVGAPVLIASVGRRPNRARARHGWRRAVLVIAAAVIVAGFYSQRQIDTRGLERNAVTAMIASAMPRVAATALMAERRLSPFGSENGLDLTRLRGRAAGMNVVLIALESTGAQYLRPFGASDDPMPVLTDLARTAIVFERAYAAYPESIKSLFALLCAREPPADFTTDATTPDACAPLAGELADAGYRTALFHSGRFAYLGMDAVVAKQRFGLIEDAGAIGGQVRSSFGVDEPSTVQRMLNWIDGEANAPFFLTYLPVAGHHPYASPEPGPFFDGSEMGAYKDALRYGDRALGTFLDGLRARALLERTLIVVVGDHGEAFGQHPGNAGHTMFLYEENVHVPLVVALPGVTTHERVTRVSSVVDIAPTILELIGHAIPGGFVGRSLLGPEERMAIFETDYSLPWRGLRDGCWKYLLQTDVMRSQLYDLCADPAETRDVSAANPERVRRYRLLFR